MTKDEWIAQIPATEDLTIDEALRVASVPLRDSKALVDSIFFSYHGTVPPPPWPAPPSMVAARREVTKLTEGLETLQKKNVHRFNPDFTAKLRGRILETGSGLWDETDRLEAKWKEAQGRTELIKSTVVNAGRFIRGDAGAFLGGLPTLAVIGAGLYVIYRVERHSHKSLRALVGI